MRLRYFFFGGFILALCGCTDTADSVAREYRNTINEAIDAMMMVTDERSAVRMRDRILKPLSNRFKEIDNRMKLVRNNRTKQEFADEFLKSDGVQMYLAELEINKQRFSLEMTRLRTLYETLGEKEDNPAEALPALTDIVRDDGLTGSIREQLNSPKMKDEMSNMAGWAKEQKVKGYDKLLKDFLKRREKFIPNPEIKLTN